MATNETFDYIVIGAGSAGCVLAARLTEDNDARVLIIEAGGPDRDPLIHIPLGLGKILPERRHDWGYDTEPEPNLDNRVFEATRGKVLGGSSSINAMGYVRGNRGDYDRWRQFGLAGWSFADVLPYFKRTESWQGGADDYRGGDGPLRTRPRNPADPLFNAYIEAGREAGYPLSPDYNGAQQEGFAIGQANIGSGKRMSAAVVYLRPAMSRPNLSVVTDALVSRIVIENGRAIGVEYRHGGQIVTVAAKREVIVSGGAINSPQVLMLSGIGDTAHLQEMGIDMVHHLPGVGRNLQDHLSATVQMRRSTPGPFRANLRYDRLAFNMARAYLTGTGPATNLPLGPMAFLKSRPELELPDIQFLFQGTPPGVTAWFPGIRPGYQDGFCCRPVLLRPESRGTITLASNAPERKVVIRQNFFDSENDVRTLRDGFKMARNVMSQPALAVFHDAELAPGPDVQSDDEIDSYNRATATTAHHPLGTCKMGIDDNAVVDAELRVRGLDGLRVVDASAMPDLVGGNINAAVLMIAEKASDMIRGRAPMAPVEI
ncbi:MAG: choline dehydrogenase [Pseudomonadota bacterium]|nr:choline dehydrogenase [Pseudomonadota bacterium]